MNRRDVITLISSGIAFALTPQRARSAEQAHRIAFVAPTGLFVDGDTRKDLVVAFLNGMQELGYVEGKNMMFEFHSAQGKFAPIRSNRGTGA